MDSVVRNGLVGLSLSALFVACGGASTRNDESPSGAASGNSGGGGSGAGIAGSGNASGTSAAGNIPSNVELPPELRAELEDFCNWWGQLSCDVALERAPLRVDAEHCVRTETMSCAGLFVPRFALALREGRVVYHPENRARVVADLRAAMGSYSEREAMPSWRSLFQGTVLNGEPCFNGEGYGFYVNECEAGSCPYGACPGICEPFPGPDDECDWSENRCAPSAYCDVGCHERPAEGEECDQEFDVCLPPFRCLVNSASGSHCGPPAALDETCERTSECVEGACLEGLCKLSPANEPCEVASECDLDLSCIGGICASPMNGSSTASSCSTDRDCVEGQMCLHGDMWSGCGEPVRLGSGCNPYQGCPMGLVCNSDGDGFGTCTPPGEVGDACGPESCSGGTSCVGWDFEAMKRGTCSANGLVSVCDPTP